jgi:NADP-dependent 3-hydroxy acid dehydrogenase YdfG
MGILNKKMALVTGYATAKELIENGATFITGRRQAPIYKAAEELGAIPFLVDQANLGVDEQRR